MSTAEITIETEETILISRREVPEMRLCTVCGAKLTEDTTAPGVTDIEIVNQSDDT